MNAVLDPIEISAEIFPPKTQDGEAALLQTVSELTAAFTPSFLSVTYGAGGSSQDSTVRIVQKLTETANFPVYGHLTCVGRSKQEVNEVAALYKKIGVKKIVALRGDPQNSQPFQAHPEGYVNAADLIAGLREIDAPESVAAAYPEKHPESPSVQADIENLKCKQDAGATSAITQFFFNNEDYYRFLDACLKAGVNIPILPGILPITHFENAKKFADRCGAAIPDQLGRFFTDPNDPPAVRQAISVHLAAKQCLDLYKNGIKKFHFYTLNKSELTLAVIRILQAEIGLCPN